MYYLAGKADAAVIGAGHAGIEAACACAKMGLETVVFTVNLDAVGNMPCNPAIGGTAKGQLVYEIDALGGLMPVIADQVTLQSRVLNAGKGPAVRSKRIQADRGAYRKLMKETLENIPRLRMVQAEIAEIETETGEDGKTRVKSVVTSLGGRWEVNAAIICTGTFLRGRTIIGDVFCSSGPDGMLPANLLTASLNKLGVSLMRFKTGTPPRIHSDSIDYSKLEIQPGDTDAVPYSTLTDPEALHSRPNLVCHIAYTNASTHEIIRENLSRSPLYSGKIEGTGPRYCPSIEDKVVRFADKERHQLFVEPTGLTTKEMYLQGFSSSMPADVQLTMLHSLSGFERAHVMRPAYAIEYDCADPTQLTQTLEFREISGLFGAGQFNGTSGYEEAAAQGLVAGINAALKLKGEEPLILTRSSSYIGTLIDDLVTKGTREPYRMMTSRSEFRLLLREDNADQRLCELGRRVGLLDDRRWEAYQRKSENIDAEILRAQKTYIKPSAELSDILESRETAKVTDGARLDELIRRPQLSYEALAPVDPTRPKLDKRVIEAVETALKYDGYVKREMAAAQRFEKLESKKLPPDLDYASLSGLRLEARQKLAKLRPETIGRASRISGVSPADITALLIHLGLK